MILTWTPSLSVHVVALDKQHIELFKRTNSFIAAVMDGKGEKEVKKVLDFLEAYVVEHFAHEEKLMKGSNYPGYDGHKTEHERFIADLAAFKLDFQFGKDSERLVETIHRRIGDWWKNHIAVSDRAMGLYVSEYRPKD